MSYYIVVREINESLFFDSKFFKILILIQKANNDSFTFMDNKYLLC